MKKILVLMIVIPVLAGLAGCGSGTPGLSNQAQSESVARTDTVIIALNPESEPEAGFDPAYGWGAGEHVHEPLIQSTLTVTTPNLEIAYDLATDLSVSENGLIWTANIRDDVVFTDGESLTAYDVAFTFNTVKEQSTVNDFTMLDRAEAVNDTTVAFHLNKPYSIWPYSMAHVGIIPEHAHGPNYGENPVGSGRYRLVQWDRGQQVILEANPDYHGAAPCISTVVIVFMSEENAFAAVQAGQVDVAYTAASYSEQVPYGYSLLAVETVDNRGINLPAITFDGEKGNNVTGDPAVRMAVNIGIDRDRLIKNVLYGYGTPAWSVSDRMPWFHDETVESYDLNAAQTILEDAGWVPSEDGIREKGGLRAEFDILYPAGDSVRQSIAAEVSNQLRELGIDAGYEGVGWDTAYDRAQREPFVWGWGAHTPMEMYNIYHTESAGSLAQYSPYANSTVDSLMDQALMENSLEASYDLWRQAQVETAKDIPWVWLVNIDHLYWVRDGLQIAEQKLHPHGHGWSIVNNVDRWSREQ